MENETKCVGSVENESMVSSGKTDYTMESTTGRESNSHSITGKHDSTPSTGGRLKRPVRAPSSVRFTPEVMRHQRNIKTQGIAQTKKKLEVKKTLLGDNMRKRKPSEHALNVTGIKTRPPMFKKRRNFEQGDEPPRPVIPDYRKNDPQPILWNTKEANEFIDKFINS